MVALCGVTSKSLKFMKSVDFELKQVLMLTMYYYYCHISWIGEKKPLGNHIPALAPRVIIYYSGKSF